MEEVDLSIFDLSPIPMWLQDFSGIRNFFAEWTAQGIIDIEQYLLEDPNRFRECLASIRTLHINKSSLDLYEANSLEEILENFSKFHFEEITIHQIKFFVGLWVKNDGSIMPAVNYTCSGRQIDVQLRANIIEGFENSWKYVLLTTDDISQYQNARRFAESLFIHSPTALWVKDYSAVKILFDRLQQQGIHDLKQYISQHPEFLSICFQSVRSIDVNQALLTLFKANNKQHFDQNTHFLFSENSRQHFQDELLHLWQGHSHLERDCEYKTLEKQSIHVREQLMVFPNAVNTWDTIQIAYTDFTARKELETYLHYLSHHDELTELYNRNFFNAEVKRLQIESILPTACIYFDINGLKTINDLKGHHCGDLLLKRFANILRQATLNTHYSVSRLGGDEFVILMPSATEAMAYQLLSQIQADIIKDNIEHPHSLISVAYGVGCTDTEPNIETLIKMTDLDMYEQKNLYYQNYRS